jgi:hypothetical protein
MMGQAGGRAAAWEKVPKGVSENKQRTKGDTAESDQPSKPMHIHQALQSLLYLALGRGFSLARALSFPQIYKMRDAASHDPWLASALRANIYVALPR